MKKIINWFTYSALVIAFIVGYVNFSNNHELNKLELLADENLTLGDADADIYKVHKNENLIGYLSTGEAQGYGGPLQVAVIADTLGVIVGTELVKSYETASFLAKVTNRKYYEQFAKKVVNDKFELKDDIAAVSGATITSSGIANATREASYKIAEEKLLIEVPIIEKKWVFTYKEAIVALIFILGILSVFFKKENRFIRKKQIRYVSLLLGFIFIGFMYNASLSLTHFGRVFFGYFPDIHTHFVWWLLMGGTFLILIIWGKNVYCSSICPFHATQKLLNMISGIKLKLPKKLSKIAVKTPSFLLWLSLILIFISANPTISSYEPFAMLFALEGVGIQWYILPAALIGSLFFSNFFCRFFCPVGATFKWIQEKRKQLITVLNKS